MRRAGRDLSVGHAGMVGDIVVKQVNLRRMYQLNKLEELREVVENNAYLKCKVQIHVEVYERVFVPVLFPTWARILDAL